MWSLILQAAKRSDDDADDLTLVDTDEAKNEKVEEDDKKAEKTESDKEEEAWTKGDN